MMSEIFMFLGVVFITGQSSCVLTSLILVPSSVIFISFLSKNMSYSGLMSYIFIMIFIGGLMVLLVSVASTVQQEQDIFPSLLLITLTILITLVSISMIKDLNQVNELDESFTMIIMLMDFVKTMSIISILLILILALMIMSKLLLDFKGLTRTL